MYCLFFTFCHTHLSFDTVRKNRYINDSAVETAFYFFIHVSMYLNIALFPISGGGTHMEIQQSTITFLGEPDQEP